MTKQYYEKVYKRGQQLKQSLMHFELHRDNQKKKPYLTIPKPYNPIRKNDMDLNTYLKSDRSKW